MKFPLALKQTCCRAWKGAISIANGLAGFFGGLIIYITLQIAGVTDLSPPDGFFGVAVVGILLFAGTLPLVLAIRFILAPYWLIKEKNAEIFRLRLELHGVNENPLKVTFDDKNTGGYFWSQEGNKIDEDQEGNHIYEFGIQYRLAIRNRSQNTIFAVSGYIDWGSHIFPDIKFARTMAKTCDLHPDSIEYVNVYFYVEGGDGFLKFIKSDPTKVHTIHIRGNDMKEIRLQFSFDQNRIPALILHDL